MRNRIFNVLLWLCPMCNRHNRRIDSREAEQLQLACRCGWDGSYPQIVLGEVMRHNPRS